LLIAKTIAPVKRAGDDRPRARSPGATTARQCAGQMTARVASAPRRYCRIALAAGTFMTPATPA
jgi:hypothetical protein